MSLKYRRAREWLARRQQRPKRDYPVATLAHYGATRTVATKVVAGLILEEDGEVADLARWFAEEGDIRDDAAIFVELVDWLKVNEVQRVVIADGLMGCPHEEGIDYPEGGVCPRCPAWADEPLTYSRHCQVVTHEGVGLEVQIYAGVEGGWILEVVNARGTSIVWDDRFETDDEAFEAFRKTLDQQGLAAFADE